MRFEFAGTTAAAVEWRLVCGAHFELPTILFDPVTYGQGRSMTNEPTVTSTRHFLRCPLSQMEKAVSDHLVNPLSFLPLFSPPLMFLYHLKNIFDEFSRGWNFLTTPACGGTFWRRHQNSTSWETSMIYIS